MFHQPHLFHSVDVDSFGIPTFTITRHHLGVPLSEFLRVAAILPICPVNCSIARVLFEDVVAPRVHEDAEGRLRSERDALDVYEIQLQSLAGAGRGFVDCKTKLNGATCWQVTRRQLPGAPVGDVLVKMAGAEGKTALQFFGRENLPTLIDGRATAA